MEELQKQHDGIISVLYPPESMVPVLDWQHMHYNRACLADMVAFSSSTYGDYIKTNVVTYVVYFNNNIYIVFLDSCTVKF